MSIPVPRCFRKELTSRTLFKFFILLSLNGVIGTLEAETTATSSAPRDPVSWCVGHPSLAPKEVTLTKATAFPVMMNGKVSGSINAAPGCLVPVLMIDPEGVTVRFGESETRIPVDSTDLIRRVEQTKEWVTPPTATSQGGAESPKMTTRMPPKTTFSESIPASALSITNQPGGGALTGGSVSVSKSGNNVILSNGILVATITPGASISSLKYNGTEMCTSIYYSFDGGPNYRTPGGGEYFVKTETPDLVDVGFKNIRRNEPQAFDCEIHYVLKRGASGIYSYAILNHPADYPASGFGEWRFVWKHPPGLLENIYVDRLRYWTMPSEDDFKAAKPTGIKEIVQLTTGPWAGKYDCKYDYSVSYHDAGCWGHASDRNKIGEWIVAGGYDYLNDGPTKYDLNAAHGYTLIHFGRDHYGGSGTHVEAGQTWEKIFGPFLIYCNTSQQGGDGCWDDAKAQVVAEKSAWPYSWLTGIPSYPPASERGAVSGLFAVKDSLKPGFKPTNTWIGLATPPPGGNWQTDSMSYQYWAKPDADGKFTIPSVRSGNYTLYAFTDGEVGEYSRADVAVTAGKTNDLGTVTWDVPRKGKTLAWEIGVPDRTSGKFRHGLDGIRDYIWMHFQEEFKNPIEFTVGKSDPAKDLNYVHSWYLEGDKRVPWKWRINFNLPELPTSGEATLTLSIAAAHDRAHVNVYVNDESRPLGTVTPSIQGGNAMLRDGNHAKYCVEHLGIPVSMLKKGDNTITLEQTSMGTQAHVMYDSISLELP